MKQAEKAKEALTGAELPTRVEQSLYATAYRGMSVEQREVERAIASTIIYFPGLFGETDGVINEMDFTDPISKAAYMHCASAHAGGRGWDMLTFAEALRLGSGETPGLSIVDIMDHNTVALSGFALVEHCTILRNYTIRREFSRALVETLDREKGMDASVMVEHVSAAIEGVITSLFPVSENTGAEHAFAELIEKVEKSMQCGGALTGVPSGLIELDKITGGFQEGKNYVIAGRPGMGKTSLALTCAWNAAHMYERRVILFTHEMTRADIMAKIVSHLTGIPTQRIASARLTEDEFRQVLECSRLIEKVGMDIICGVNEIEAMMGMCRSIKNKKGLDLIIIDYLQLCTSKNFKRSDNRTVEVGNVSRAVKNNALKLKTPVLLLSQLSREVEKRASKKPKLSDLLEAGAIEADADMAMFPFRPAYYWPEDYPEDAVELDVAKNRMGPLANINLAFNGPTTWFHNCEDVRYKSVPAQAENFFEVNRREVDVPF